MATANSQPPRRGPHGYPTQIIQGPVGRTFLCSRCKWILKHPIQALCGHRFCKECIDYLIEIGGSNVMCPSCQEEGNDNEDSKLDVNQTFPDRGIKWDLLKKDVRCAYDGCSWEGTFKLYKEHESECLFKPVPCECGAEISDRKMEEHKREECPLRTVTCPHCKNKMIFQELDTHNLSCPAYPATCPDCGQPNIPRNQMEAHTDLNTGDCTKPVRCPYGCEELVQRTRMHEHKKEKNGLHLDKLRERVETLECVSSGQRTLVGDSGTDRVETLSRQIETLERQLSEIPQIQPNRPRHYVNSQVAEAAAVRPKDKAAVSDSSVLSATSGSGDPQLSMLEFKVEAFENMVAVLNTQMNLCQGQNAELEQQRRIDRDALSRYETKTRNLERAMAMKDVALAEHDLRMQSVDITEYEGILRWKITDFSRKTQEAINGRTTNIFSPAFYTSRTGYKMCASMMINGDGIGRGTHISLFFVIMRGQYDASLRWPFMHKVTLMLLDQNNREHIIDAFRPDPTSSSFKRPVSDKNIASGNNMFVRLVDLENSRHAYLKDNTLFIKILVGTSNLS